MKNSKVIAIIKNEVERSIKNKWFVILNLLMLASVVVGLNFNNIKALLKSNNVDLSSHMEIKVEDKDNIAFKKLEEIFNINENVTVIKVDSIEEFKNENLSKDVILLKIEKSKTNYIDASIISQETVSSSYIDKIEQVLTSIKEKMLTDNKNLTQDEIAQIKEGVKIDRVFLSEKIDTDNSTAFLQIVSNYLIFFILLLCLNKIANTISQEKMSKSIEYILTSITTKEYLISKVISMCLTVVIQFIFTLAYLVIAILVSSLFTTLSVNTGDMNAIDLSSILSFKTMGYIGITLVYMCLTTFIQGIIQSVMSAKTTNIQEAGNATVFLVMLNLILYTIVLAMVSPLKEVGVISYILSVIPIASMYFIPAMYLVGQASIIQVVISLIILIASIPLSLIFAQKPFKNAILDYTNKKNKKIEGIEKIIATREYQERMINRKESSKKGLVIGFCVMLFIVLQLVLGFIISLTLDVISSKITFISKDNISLILMCVMFVIALYIPYLVLKAYLPKEEKQEQSKEEKKASIIKCVKYIVLSIPVMSLIQMICSFAIEKTGIGSDITEALGLFNYSGKLASFLVFVQIAILPAIFEELFIRKGIMGILKEKGAIFATVVSAVIFATIHLNFSQFIFAFLIGLLFGFVRTKTNKMYPTMILHFINNGAAVIEVLFFDRMIFMDIFTYAQIALNAVGLCILIYMVYKKFMELKDKESINKLKEQLDYRKIKLNITENMFVFKDYTFFIAAILCSILFAVVERML